MPQFEPSRPSLRRTQKVLTILLVVVFGSSVFARFMRSGLPEPSTLQESMLNEPLQVETERVPFSFEYENTVYDVEPVADYELWGLVVSHNDIDGFGDIYHDSSSVDTKDLCVIWGDNLRSKDYLEVEFWSGSFTCYWQYQSRIRFSGRAIANNHLVTNNQAIRDLIETVRVGDQVRVRGSLVNYQMASYPGSWRTTSTRRDDSEGGACEVIFVDEFEIVKRGKPLWYFLTSLLSWLVALILVGKIGLVGWETVSGRTARTNRTRSGTQLGR